MIPRKERMALTRAQRSVLVSLSDGGWSDDRGGFWGFFSPGVLARLDYAGLIRSDVSHGRYDERNWTITPEGLEALGADQ